MEKRQFNMKHPFKDTGTPVQPIGDPNIRLTVGDPNIALTVSQEGLKDDLYRRSKRFTKKQLTDMICELEMENEGMKWKLLVYESLFGGIKDLKHED